MKKLFSALLCLLGTSLLCSAFGATPVAVWDGASSDYNFSHATQGTFTITATNGNTIAEDGTYIQIAESCTGGVVFTGPESSLISNTTVIIRGSNLTLSSTTNLYLISVFTNNAANASMCNVVGACVGANEGGVAGIWQNAVWTSSNSNNMQTRTTLTSGENIVFKYPKVTGTYVYEITTDETTGDRSLTTCFGATGLRASGTAYEYQGFTLGGANYSSSSSIEPATGWKIEKVAVFDEALSDDEILAYAFPSESASYMVTENTSVSTINAALEAEGKTLTLDVPDGVTITYDVAFEADAVNVVCTGNVTFATSNYEITDAEIAKLNLSDVEGAAVRSWVTDTVLGINFNSSNATNTTSAYASGTWIDTTGATGSSTNLVSDGLSTVTWSANNVYATAGSNSMSASDSGNEFICGYLDDSSGVTITMSAVPFAKYDVIIYCATDTSSAKFSYKTVNGTNYTWDDTTGTVIQGTTSWGDSSQTKDKKTALYGSNALRINDLTGALTISSVRADESGTVVRGGISGIQIVSSEAVEPTLTVGDTGATDVSWSSTTAWNTTAPTSGTANIVLTGDATVTVDETVSLSAVTVSGTGTLTIDVSSGASFTATSLQSSIPIALKNDITVDLMSVTGGIYYDYAVSTIESHESGAYYRAGSGSSDSPAIAYENGGSATLIGDSDSSLTYYIISNSCSATQTSYEITNATVSVTHHLGVGQADYVIAGSSALTTPWLLLSEGGASRTATMTLKDTASVTVSGTRGYGSVDSAEADIIFGFYNGASTFTLQDSATFTASSSEVLVGRAGNTQTINLNGGTLTALGVKASTNASGTNTLNLNGGTLNLSTTGIASYGTTTINVNVTGNSTLGAVSTVGLPITQPVALSNSATLSLSNVTYNATAAESQSNVATTLVSLSDNVTGTGTIVVGPKVNLWFGTDSRPDSNVTIDLSDTDAQLTLTLASDIEEVALTITGDSVTDRMTIYSSSGETLTTSDVVSSSDNGVYTISANVKIFTANAAAVSLTDTSLWSGSTAATNDETFVIDLLTDATLTLDSSVTEYGKVYVTNTNGVDHTLTVSANFPASSLYLGDNVILAYTNVTDEISTPMSGTGSVVYSSGVTAGISGSNDYTGGTTIAEGAVVTLSTTNALGAVTTVSGAGQVIITNGTCIAYGSGGASNASVTNPLGVTFTNTAWTGTVTLRGATLSDKYQNYSYYANSGSTLEIDGMGGYCQYHTVTAKEIKLSKTTLSGSNGNYGFGLSNGNSSTAVIFVGKLTGDGPIALTGSPQVSVCFVGDCTEWTGAVSLTSGMRLFFVASTSDTWTNNNSTYNKYITVSTNVTMTTWSSASTLVVDDGVTLNVSSNTAVTASSAMTLAAGAQIKATDTTEASPATFTAALTINGDTTITGGHVKATSATASGGTIVLGDLGSELILTTAAADGAVTSGVDGYVVRTKTLSDSTTAYYLGRNGIRVYIR